MGLKPAARVRTCKNLLRRTRETLGMSQVEVAFAAEVYAPILSNVEKHDFYPRDEIRCRVARALRVPEDVIWPYQPAETQDAADESSLDALLENLDYDWEE